MSSDAYTVGKGKVYFRKFTTLPTDWTASAAYAPSAYVNGKDGSLWTTVSGGTAGSGSTGPVGTTGTFVDGTVTWTAVPWVALGNAPAFKWNAEVEFLDHYSSTTGIKTRDKRVVVTRKGSLDITLDEITSQTLEIAVMGTQTGGSIKVFDAAQIDCQIKFTGTNTVGNRFEGFYGNVSLTPGKELDWIGEGWMQAELTGEVNADGSGNFGTITPIA